MYTCSWYINQMGCHTLMSTNGPWHVTSEPTNRRCPVMATDSYLMPTLNHCNYWELQDNTLHCAKFSCSFQKKKKILIMLASSNRMDWSTITACSYLTGARLAKVEERYHFTQNYSGSSHSLRSFPVSVLYAH